MIRLPIPIYAIIARRNQQDHYRFALPQQQRRILVTAALLPLAAHFAQSVHAQFELLAQLF